MFPISPKSPDNLSSWGFLALRRNSRHSAIQRIPITMNSLVYSICRTGGHKTVWQLTGSCTIYTHVFVPRLTNGSLKSFTPSPMLAPLHPLLVLYLLFPALSLISHSPAFSSANLLPSYQLFACLLISHFPAFLSAILLSSYQPFACLLIS